MIYFFKFEEGEPFAIDDDTHAWNLYADRNNDKNRIVTYVGQSDGTAFKKVKSKRIAELSEIKAKIENKENLMIKYEEGKDKLFSEKFLTEDDIEVKRAEKAIKKAKAEYLDLMKIRNKQAKSIHGEALAAELKEAKKNTLPPLNKDVIRSSVVDNPALLSQIKNR